MNMTKIVAISAFGILLSACSSSQSQIEGTSSAVPEMGPVHVHNIEGHGDFSHKHQGNSTTGHGHSWEQIQNELKSQ